MKNVLKNYPRLLLLAINAEVKTTSFLHNVYVTRQTKVIIL